MSQAPTPQLYGCPIHQHLNNTDVLNSNTSTTQMSYTPTPQLYSCLKLQHLNHTDVLYANAKYSHVLRTNHTTYTCTPSTLPPLSKACNKTKLSLHIAPEKTAGVQRACHCLTHRLPLPRTGVATGTYNNSPNMWRHVSTTRYICLYVPPARRWLALCVCTRQRYGPASFQFQFRRSDSLSLSPVIITPGTTRYLHVTGSRHGRSNAACEVEPYALWVGRGWWVGGGGGGGGREMGRQRGSLWLWPGYTEGKTG